MLNGSAQRYLWQSTINEIPTENNVQMLVDQDKSIRYLDPEARKAFTKRVVEHAKKLFIIVAASDIDNRMDFLRELLDHGITDNSLPFTQDDCLATRHHKRWADHILPLQGLVLAPFLSEATYNTSVRAEAPLLFQSEGNTIGEGAGGEVYPIRIDSQNYDFPNAPLAPSVGPFSQQFALKIIKEEKYAKREEKFLIAIKDVRNDHLLRTYAAFWFDGEYYLISDLADSGDAEKFMERNLNGGIQGVFTRQWLEGQMLGLAKALRAIHTPKERHTGYIHDVKPANILVFGSHDNQFRLTDWGCAKVSEHKCPSHRSGFWGNETYNPPETENSGRTSRPHDLWALGCTYLEFLIWFLEDWEALEVFRKSLRDRSQDEAFWEGNGTSKSVKPPVLEKIGTPRTRFRGGEHTSTSSIRDC